MQGSHDSTQHGTVRTQHAAPARRTVAPSHSACGRTPDGIRALADGQAYFTFANERASNAQADWRQWPFDRDFRILVNLAVGGNWGGQKGVEESIWPQRLELDYVRVLQRTR